MDSIAQDTLKAGQVRRVTKGYFAGKLIRVEDLPELETASGRVRLLLRRDTNVFAPFCEEDASVVRAMSEVVTG